jgi:hypothetical protein
MLYNARQVAETERRSITGRYRSMQSISSAGRKVRWQLFVGAVGAFSEGAKSAYEASHVISSPE